MEKKWVQHIGDDQLVYGMPKHMVGVFTLESLRSLKETEANRQEISNKAAFDPKGDYYWTVHPKPNACAQCQAMAGKEFMEEPPRPHPNCKCEIKKHPLRRQKQYINGAISGHTWERFSGGAQVKIVFHGISGGFTAGIHLMSNQGHSMQIACVPLTDNPVRLTSAQPSPVDWQITLLPAGSDNVLIYYTIIYEDWSE